MNFLRRNEMDTEDKLYLILIAFLISLIPTILFGADQYQQYQCNNYSEITHKETKYKHFDSCYIKVGNTYQRWNEYLYRSATNQSEENK